MRVQHLWARISVAVLGLLLGLFGPATAQAAKVQATILSVNLKNPVAANGNGVSQITFSVESPGIGRRENIGTNPADISVSSRPGADRYHGAGGTQAGLDVGFVGKDVVNITLTPLRVYRPGENVRFTLTVQGTNTIQIASAINGTQAPMWFDNSSPPRTLRPGPTPPGLTVNPRDAEYLAYNNTDSAFRITNLGYLPDMTQSQFDSIDLDAVLAQTPNLPGITLSPGGTFDQTGLPDPQPGNLFAAVGQLVDPTDNNVVGSFAEAVVTAVPEPRSITLMLVGLGVLGAVPLRAMVRPGRGGLGTAPSHVMTHPGIAVMGSSAEREDNRWEPMRGVTPIKARTVGKSDEAGRGGSGAGRAGW
jgi:hypothetical protein